MSITVIVGENGSGKDMYAMEAGVVPSWSYGRLVVSNTTLYPEMLGFDPALYMPLGDPSVTLPRLGRHVKRMCARCRNRVHPRSDECRRCEGDGVVVDVERRWPGGGYWSLTANKGCAVLVSDVTAVFPCRESVNTIPPELAQTAQQLRKPDLAPFMITCPALDRVDVLLRECASRVVETFPWSPFGLWRDNPEVPWGWPNNRAFIRYTHRARDYERATKMGAEATLREMVRPKRLWRQRKVRALQSAYDSFEDVELSDHIACQLPECGGRYSRTACRQPHEHRRKWRDEATQRDREQFPLERDEAWDLAEPDGQDHHEAERAVAEITGWVA